MHVVKVNDVKLPPPWTREGHRNAHAWFTETLSHAPVAVDKESGVWQFLGYDTVRGVLMQPGLWSIAKRLENIAAADRIIRLLNSDPPLHMLLRGNFASSYRPARIVALEQRMRAVSNTLLDQCLEKGKFDVITDLMQPFATIMICEIIGIPEDGQQIMLPLGRTAVPLGRVDAPDGSTLLDKLYGGGGFPNAGLVLPYLSSLLEDRRKAPQDDLLSSLAAIPPAQLEDRLNIPALLFEQFGAGTNTTVHLFASILVMLDERPEMQTILRDEPGLINGMIEETLRFHSPLQARPRVATQDVRYNDHVIPEGSTALVWLAAANVDSAKFPHPLEYDIRRSPNSHIGFGFNEHFCLGAHLARMELRVMMEGWLNKIASFERSGSGALDWLNDFVLHGLERYPVTCKPNPSRRAA